MQPGNLEIAGMVTDDTDQALEDAEVLIEGLVVKTNKYGYFNMQLPKMPENGTYGVRVHKEGYKSKNVTDYEIPKTNFKIILNKSNNTPT
jgi:hypothetical protein